MQIYWVILILLAGLSQASGQGNPADALLEGSGIAIEDEVMSLPAPSIPAIEPGSLILQIEEFELDGNVKDAIMLNEQLLELIPNSPEVFNNLARLHSINRDYDKAIEVLESGIATNKTFDIMHQNLRKLFLELARQVYQEALNEPTSNGSNGKQKDTPIINLVRLKIPLKESEINFVTDRSGHLQTPITAENKALRKDKVVDIVIPVIEDEPLPPVKEIIFTDDAYDFPSASNDLIQFYPTHSALYMKSALTYIIKQSNEVRA